MPLVLSSKIEGSLPVDATGLLPESLRGQSTQEVQRRLIRRGREQVAIGELFDVSGTTDHPSLRFEGDLHAVHNLGAGMAGGDIVAAGLVGLSAGARMRGGRLTVEGGAGDGAGTAMRGGQLRISGNAGQGLGGAEPGSPRGMTGGLILVDGNAGEGVGRTMRRGVIAIGGDTGACPAWSMVAGTLVVGGRCGDYPGGGMSRGTILLLGQHLPELLPTFREACLSSPAAIGLLLRWLEDAGFAGAAYKRNRQFIHYSGDHLGVGQGELLISAEAA